MRLRVAELVVICGLCANKLWALLGSLADYERHVAQEPHASQSRTSDNVSYVRL